MRFLIQQGAGANFYIRNAWVTALRRIGHDVVYWNDQSRSPLDIFFEFKPDVFIGSTWQLNTGIVKALAKYPETKIALCANNWGENDEEVKKQFSIEFASDKEKLFVEQLRKLTGKPDFIFCQYHDRYAKETHKLWRNVGCEPYGIMTCANIDEYQLTEPSKGRISDVVFVGGYWPYKSKQIAPYLFPLTNTSLDVKIFGFGGWPVPNFLGGISSALVCPFYSSAKVCPNIFEPHSLALGYDVNQRTFQISAAGGFQVCQNVQSVKEDIFPEGGCVFADNQEDFLAKCLFYIQNPDQRIDHIIKGIHEVYFAHTNYHRTAQLMELLELHDEDLKLVSYAHDVFKHVSDTIGREDFRAKYLELYK